MSADNTQIQIPTIFSEEEIQKRLKVLTANGKRKFHPDALRIVAQSIPQEKWDKKELYLYSLFWIPELPIESIEGIKFDITIHKLYLTKDKDDVPVPSDIKPLDIDITCANDQGTDPKDICDFDQMLTALFIFEKGTNSLKDIQMRWLCRRCYATGPIFWYTPDPDIMHIDRMDKLDRNDVSIIPNHKTCEMLLRYMNAWKQTPEEKKLAFVARGGVSLKEGESLTVANQGRRIKI